MLVLLCAVILENTFTVFGSVWFNFPEAELIPLY